MSDLNSYNGDTAHSLLDYPVLDQTGSEIGKVHSFWAETQNGKLEFLGVKTGWLFGMNHVMPAAKVEIDASAGNVRVPYTSEFVKGAPSIDADSSISDEQESEIYRYYGVQRGAAAQSSATGNTTAGIATGSAAAVTGLANNAPSAMTNAVTPGTTSTAGATDKTGDREITLSEEEVKVGKRTVDAGSVRLRKIVRTEIVNQPVEVRHEDVVIERVSADQVHAETATTDFKDETIDVPLTREEVVVAKEAHVTGAVRLHKTEDVETRNVSETVRKEDVEVLRDGKTDAVGTDRSARP